MSAYTKKEICLISPYEKNMSLNTKNVAFFFNFTEELGQFLTLLKVIMVPQGQRYRGVTQSKTPPMLINNGGESLWTPWMFLHGEGRLRRGSICHFAQSEPVALKLEVPAENMLTSFLI